MHVYSMSQWLSQVSNCVIFSRFDLCQVGDGASLIHMWLLLHHKAQKKRHSKKDTRQDSGSDMDMDTFRRLSGPYPPQWRPAQQSEGGDKVNLPLRNNLASGFPWLGL